MESEKATAWLEQWEYEMHSPLPWQSERKVIAATTQSDREAFLALDEIETH